LIVVPLQAHAACEVNNLSGSVLAVAAQQKSPDDTAQIAYGALASALPKEIDETTFGPIIRKSVLPPAIAAAAGDAKKLKTELTTRVAALCAAVSGDAPAKPAGVAGPTAKADEDKPSIKDVTNALGEQATDINSCAGALYPRRCRPSAKAKDPAPSTAAPSEAASAPSPDAAPAAKTPSAADSPNPGAKQPGNAAPDLKATMNKDCGFWDDSDPTADINTPDKATGLSRDNPLGVWQAMRECSNAAKAYHDANKSPLVSDAKQQTQADTYLGVITSRDSLLSAHGSAFLGPQYSINADGSFAGGYQLLLSFDSQALDHQSTPVLCPSGFLYVYWCRLTSEVEYSKYKFSGTDNTTDFNPFKSTNGTLKIDQYYKLRFSDYAGITLGGGFTAPIAPGANATDHIEPRMMAGVDIDTVFSSDAGQETGFGELFGGIARDQAWVTCPQPGSSSAGPIASCTAPQKAYGRYVIDGRYLIPGTTWSSFKLAARFYIDGPLNGRGDYQIRIGLLAFKDINGWLSPSP